MNMYDLGGRMGGDGGFFDRFLANTIEADDCDFLSSNSWPPTMAMTTTNTATNTAPSFLTHSPPHLSTSAQQMLLLEQLEQLQHLAELAASESPPNTAITNSQLTTITQPTQQQHQQQHLLSEQQSQQLQQQHQQQLLHQTQPQLPTQLMMIDNNGDLVEQFFVNHPIDPNLHLITDHPTPNTHTFTQLPPHTHLSTSHPSLNAAHPVPQVHYTNSIQFPKFLTHSVELDQMPESLFNDNATTMTGNFTTAHGNSGGSGAIGPDYQFLTIPTIDQYKRVIMPNSNNYYHQHANSTGIAEAHPHSVSSSPSSYVGYVRDHYDKTCSHCQNGSQPVVLSTNAAFTTTPGLAISACSDTYCVIDAHPHPQHEPIAYPYTAEQLLRRPSLSMFQPISEPSLPTVNTAMCSECVDQHFVDGRTGPQIDLGAVPTYHVHTPTPTAHKIAKSTLPYPPQLPTQSVLRLSQQLSEDALITAVPIAESKLHPPSILKKPRIGMTAVDACLDRRKFFKEGQSRSLDYDDLHAKSWGRRRIRYVDEIYDYPSEWEEDLSRHYGSETNLPRYSGANFNYRERDLGIASGSSSIYYYRDMRRRFDSRERNHMSLDLPSNNNQHKFYDSTLPYMKRRRNLPHIPTNTQNHLSIEQQQQHQQHILKAQYNDGQNPPLPPTINTTYGSSGGVAERPGPIGGGHNDPNRLSAPPLRQSANRYRSYESECSKYYDFDDNLIDEEYAIKHNNSGMVSVSYNSNRSSARQKGREVSYVTAEEEMMQQSKSGGSGSDGFITATANNTNAAIGNNVVGSNIANNASSSSFANSHHGVANSSSPNKRASLKHTNTINDANLNVTMDGITTTSIQTTTTSTTITTTKSSSHPSTITTSITTTTNTTMMATTTPTTKTTTTSKTSDATTSAESTNTLNMDNGNTDADPDAALDVIDWDAIDAMLDDDFSEYDRDKNETGEDSKKDDENFAQSADEKVGELNILYIT